MYPGPSGYRHIMESPLGSFLCPPGYAGPSGLRALARETSAVSEAARFVRRTAVQTLESSLRRVVAPSAVADAERGQDPVVLVPGFLAGDRSLSLMSRHLRAVGYRTYRSLMHATVGCTKAGSHALEERIEAIVLKRGRKVTIVGHSLGGLLARGLAGLRPDLVKGIVTLGSPILAPGAAHPLLLFDLRMITRLQRSGLSRALGRMMGEDCTSGECARLSWEQARVPLRPEIFFTSVFSRRDGIVDWRSCLDPEARTVEVATSHVGMAFDPVVLDVVTDALAAHRARRTRELSRQARLAVVPSASAG